MSPAEPHDRPSTPAPRRRPLSLREMLVVTTLSAVALALVLNLNLRDEERWFLSLWIGSALVGLTISRTFGRSAWLGGIVLGALAGVAAVILVYYTSYQKTASAPSITPQLLAEYRNRCLLAAATTLALGAIVVALVIGVFQACVWATTRGEQGLRSAGMRHPWRTAGVLFAAGLVALLAARLDYVLWPRAWASRYVLTLPPYAPLSYRANAESLLQVDRIALSRGGEWLAVCVYREGRRGGPTFQLYRLQATATKQEPDFVSQYFAFNPAHEHRLVYTARTPQGKGQIRTRDLASGDDTFVSYPGDIGYVIDIAWLPDGSIAVGHFGEAFALEPRGERWQRTPRNSVTVNVLLNYEIRYGVEGARVLRLDTGREIAGLTPLQLENIRITPGHLRLTTTLAISPNGRFALVAGGNEIIDLRADRHDRYAARESGIRSFEAFTRSGYAVASGFSRWNWNTDWLNDVPFGGHIHDWLTRWPILLIDPATGREVARTRPLWSPPEAIAFSHDGSRMAVLNREGVYVYDVPEEFR